MPNTELVKNLELAFKSIGEDVKKLLAQDGDLTALTTTQKASLVVAINELDAAVKAIDVKSVIDDAAADTTHAWSAKKVGDEIVAKTAALKAELLGGAGEAYDTLKELAGLIDKNKSAIDALKGIAAGHVRFDKVQELTPEQKKQALANIGAASDEAVKAAQAKADEAHTNAATNATAIGTLGNLKTAEKANVVGAVNEVKGTADKGVENAATAQAAAEAADAKAVAAQGAIDTFKEAVGDTTKDFAAVYTTARNGAAAA